MDELNLQVENDRLRAKVSALQAQVRRLIDKDSESEKIYDSVLRNYELRKAELDQLREKTDHDQRGLRLLQELDSELVVEHDDERLSYVIVQISRSWLEEQGRWAKEESDD